jgi:tRNA(His) guanylyltransferase
MSSSAKIGLAMLNGWCYWTARKQGKNPGEATQIFEYQSVGFKNEFLFQNGINFNDLPPWQRRGTGLYWEKYEKAGYNPINQKTVTTVRQCIKVDEDLPMKEDYRDFIEQLRETTQS